jgi:nitrogenase-associated protein
MAVITFYEKPGCKGNLKQKTLLMAAGHTVLAKNLKAEPWTEARLLDFLAPLPVADWFNRSAPAVQSGEVVPENLDQASALQTLLANPLLMRRPLMEITGGEGPEHRKRQVGFDTAAVDAWIGLNGVEIPEGNIEACAHHGEHGHATDPSKDEAHGSCRAH